MKNDFLAEKCQSFSGCTKIKGKLKAETKTILCGAPDLYKRGINCKVGRASTLGEGRAFEQQSGN